MYQYTHIEGFALSSAKKVRVDKKTGSPLSKPKRNVDEIIGEVLRDEGHCHHVENPQTPVIHYGDEATIRAMPKRIRANIEEWKRKGNKTPRKDTQVLMTQIASYQRGVGTAEDYADWERRTIEDMKRRWGPRLVAIVGHPEDEEHPHLHAYVLPLLGENPDVKTLHPGHVASKQVADEAAANGEEPSAKLQGRAYHKALRDFQNDYYERVAIHCGMTRIGAGRRRLTRAEKLQEKNQARQLKDALALADARQRELDQLHNDMDSVIEERALEKARHIAKATAIKWIEKEEPDLPPVPDKWNKALVNDYINGLRNVIKVQTKRLAGLPAMQEKMGLLKAEGKKAMDENTDLLARVARLTEQANAWAIVQQVYPQVAQEVVDRINKAPGALPVAGPATPSVATMPVQPVISNP